MNLQSETQKVPAVFFRHDPGFELATAGIVGKTRVGDVQKRRPRSARPVGAICRPDDVEAFRGAVVTHAGEPDFGESTTSRKAHPHRLREPVFAEPIIARILKGVFWAGKDVVVVDG